MKAIKALAVALAGITFAVTGLGEGLLKRPGEWTPFVENISHGDFLVIESKLKETLSDSCELVIYQTNQEGLDISYTMAKQADPKGYRLERRFYISEHGSSKDSPRKAVLLPENIAGRLLRAFEIALTKQVYPETGKAWKEEEPRSGSVTSQYIHLKLPNGAMVAGLIHQDRDGSESIHPFMELEYRMWHCVENNASDDPPLEKLDEAIRDFMYSYEARR